MATDICDICGKHELTQKYTDEDGRVLDLCYNCYMLHNLNDKLVYVTGQIDKIVKDRVL